MTVWFIAVNKFALLEILILDKKRLRMINRHLSSNGNFKYLEQNHTLEMDLADGYVIPIEFPAIVIYDKHLPKKRVFVGSNGARREEGR